jgi:hypothetical protein
MGARNTYLRHLRLQRTFFDVDAFDANFDIRWLTEAPPTIMPRRYRGLNCAAAMPGKTPRQHTVDECSRPFLCARECFQLGHTLQRFWKIRDLFRFSTGRTDGPEHLSPTSSTVQTQRLVGRYLNVYLEPSIRSNRLASHDPLLTCLFLTPVAAAASGCIGVSPSRSIQSHGRLAGCMGPIETCDTFFGP